MLACSQLIQDFLAGRFAGFSPGPGFALVKIRLVGETGGMKNEFVFQIERDEDALVAICHDPEMATQGGTLDELIAMIRDLIQCRFEANDERLHWPIRLHFVEDPVLSLQPA